MDPQRYPRLSRIAVPADLRPIECGNCPGWNEPQAPFRLHGNSWYVGTEGLSAVLVDSGDGLVLLCAAAVFASTRVAGISVPGR